MFLTFVTSRMHCFALGFYMYFVHICNMTLMSSRLFNESRKENWQLFRSSVFYIGLDTKKAFSNKKKFAWNMFAQSSEIYFWTIESRWHFVLYPNNLNPVLTFSSLTNEMGILLFEQLEVDKLTVLNLYCTRHVFLNLRKINCIYFLNEQL